MENPSATTRDRTGTLTTKSCSVCRQELPLQAFNKSNTARSGYQSYCRQCKKDWYQANKEAHAANVARWAIENKERREQITRKRRAVKLSLPHVAYTAQEIYERDAGVCVLCGFDVESDDYHIDHVVPLQVDATLLLSYGILEHPGDVPWNVSVAHPSCNSSKGHRMTQEDAANYALLQYLYKE